MRFTRWTKAVICCIPKNVMLFNFFEQVLKEPLSEDNLLDHPGTVHGPERTLLESTVERTTGFTGHRPTMGAQKRCADGAAVTLRCSTPSQAVLFNPMRRVCVALFWESRVTHLFVVLLFRPKAPSKCLHCNGGTNYYAVWWVFRCLLVAADEPGPF